MLKLLAAAAMLAATPAFAQNTGTVQQPGGTNRTGTVQQPSVSLQAPRSTSLTPVDRPLSRGPTTTRSASISGSDAQPSGTEFHQMYPPK